MLKNRVYGLKEAAEALVKLNGIIRDTKHAEKSMMDSADYLDQRLDVESVSTMGYHLNRDGEGDYEVLLEPSMVNNYLRKK